MTSFTSKVWAEHASLPPFEDKHTKYEQTHNKRSKNWKKGKKQGKGNPVMLVMNSWNVVSSITHKQRTGAVLTIC